ncbi:MAG: Hpt domain-containing protein, partial [Emcibacteraceae bacterium]|nr:Hpt domain-containing protein [Emcibacteraceae bacterium]
IEAMKKIKALSKAHKNIPIIALTAFSKQAIGNDFTELGMDGYLAKPISKKSLINEIKRHLNLSENKEYSALKETSVNKETLLNLINDVGFDATTRLFNVFRSETEQRFKNIKGYIQTENYPLLECESHALKSASYNFGLDQLGKTMDLMEQAAIKKDLKNIKNIAETAIQNFEIIPAEVKQL